MFTSGNRSLAGVLALLALIVGLGLGVGCASKTSTEIQRTPLDEYVEREDPAYHFEVAHSLEGEGWTYYVLDLVSQNWRSEDEVDRTEWRHWLRVVVPDKVTQETAMLMIGGGSNDRDYDETPDEQQREIALFTQSVVATLGQVPNQPLKFAGLERDAYEDDLIAYTWDKYLRSGDAEWLARLPMTKSVVRAMDAIQEFTADLGEPDINVESFMVLGGSKRGWTTWTTAAVDPRVRAISPIVINMLNLAPSFQHHWSVYGFWAPAINDYVNHNIMDWMGSPEFERMLEIIEPYHYRQRYTMPKYMVYATGDQFFLPDSTQFYWDDLPEPKYLRYVPNAGHGLDDTDAYESIMVFYNAILNDLTLPELQWSFPDSSTTRVEANIAPTEVKLWQATNPEARDFRIDVAGPIWKASSLEDNGGNVYEASVQPPEEGWTAFMIEFSYEFPGVPYPLKLTTPVQVTPKETPHQYTQPETPLGGFLSEEAPQTQASSAPAAE